MLECKAKPFIRHYDLERHFATLHQGDKERGENSLVYCDYSKCPHKEGYRRDHYREHYQEYHAEDLANPSEAIKSLKRSKNSWPLVLEILTSLGGGVFKMHPASQGYRSWVYMPGVSWGL